MSDDPDSAQELISRYDVSAVSTMSMGDPLDWAEELLAEQLRAEQ